MTCNVWEARAEQIRSTGRGEGPKSQKVEESEGAVGAQALAEATRTVPKRLTVPPAAAQNAGGPAYATVDSPESLQQELESATAKRKAPQKLSIPPAAAAAEAVHPGARRPRLPAGVDSPESLQHKVESARQEDSRVRGRRRQVVVDISKTGHSGAQPEPAGARGGSWTRTEGPENAKKESESAWQGCRGHGSRRHVVVSWKQNRRTARGQQGEAEQDDESHGKECGAERHCVRTLKLAAAAPQKLTKPPATVQADAAVQKAFSPEGLQHKVERACEEDSRVRGRRRQVVEEVSKQTRHSRTQPRPAAGAGGSWARVEGPNKTKKEGRSARQGCRGRRSRRHVVVRRKQSRRKARVRQAEAEQDDESPGKESGAGRHCVRMPKWTQ